MKSNNRKVLQNIHNCQIPTINLSSWNRLCTTCMFLTPCDPNGALTWDALYAWDLEAKLTLHWSQHMHLLVNIYVVHVPQFVTNTSHCQV